MRVEVTSKKPNWMIYFARAFRHRRGTHTTGARRPGSENERERAGASDQEREQASERASERERGI